MTNNLIDTTDTPGGGEYVWRHQATPGQAHRGGLGVAIGCMAVHGGDSGTIYVLDPTQRLAGWLTAEGVREEMDSELRELEALACEAEQSSDDHSESAELGAAIKSLETATITVESITSPRTGRKGWRVTWAA